MGEAPGSETNDYPNFTKDLFAAEASPYYAAFVQDTWHVHQRLDHHRGLALGHLRRQDGAPQPTRVLQSDGDRTQSDGVYYTGAEVYVSSGNRSPFTTNLKDFGPRLGVTWQVAPGFLAPRRRRHLLRTQPADGRQRLTR